MIDYITQIDFNILYWIQDVFKCAFLDFLMPIFSRIVDHGELWIVLALGLICFKKTRYCGFVVLVALLVDTLITEYSIKFMVCRIRPCNLVPDFNMIIDRPESYSFPSNHTASSFSASVAILMTLKKKVWSIPAFVAATIVSFSRLYLFVHFPSDVVMGLIIGSLISVAVCYLMKKSGFRLFLNKKGITV